MRYPKFHKQGFCTSTGVVEAGCKVVIGTLLKRAGMLCAAADLADDLRISGNAVQINGRRPHDFIP